MESSTARCLADFRENNEECLVIDTGNEIPEFKRWRSFHNILENTDIKIQLPVSFSGAPNNLGWENIAENIKNSTSLKRKVVLNLRQESHGYLNGYGITLTNRNNCVNLGKKTKEVLAAEKNWLNSLYSLEEIKLLPVSSYKKNNDEFVKIIKKPYVIQSEDQVLEKLGFEYIRYAVTDHRPPSDDDIDNFTNLLEELKDAWLHIHCRGGHGRSAFFSALYLINKLANVRTLEQICELVVSIEPFYDLKPGPENNAQFGEFRKEKYEIIKEYYLFSQARLNRYEKNWTHWKAEKLLNTKVENENINVENVDLDEKFNSAFRKI